jgi:hypothetical protein
MNIQEQNGHQSTHSKPSDLNAGNKSLRATLHDEILLLGILLPEPCIWLIYA